jgi:toxin ParE1/3/4
MSNTYQITYSSEALDDIRKIYSYIAFELQVPETALNQVNRIRKQIRSLNFMPMRYGIVDWEPWKSMKIHKLPIDNYIVFYLADSNLYTVTIVRIVYGGQDIEGNVKSEQQ